MQFYECYYAINATVGSIICRKNWLLMIKEDGMCHFSSVKVGILSQQYFKIEQFFCRKLFLRVEGSVLVA